MYTIILEVKYGFTQLDSKKKLQNSFLKSMEKGVIQY